MKRRGFTLIELLAVIVILAIIALIAVPIVLNIINDSKKESLQRSIDLYVDTVQKRVTQENMKAKYDPDKCIIQENGNVKCYKGEEVLKTSTGEEELKIEINGKKPKSGTIRFKSTSINNTTNTNQITYSGVVLEGMEYELKEDGTKTSKTYEPPTLATNQDYRGYYADVDGDGKADGVIYADLGANITYPVSGDFYNDKMNWNQNNGAYSYEKETGLKEYIVSKETYKKNEGFGTKPILSVKSGSTGKARFYVMALEDFTTTDYTTFYWYRNAYNKMSTYADDTKTDFGTGYTNTGKIIEIWNKNGTGEGSYTGATQDNRDIFKHIQTKYQEGWYIPSRGEWGAFADYLKQKTDNPLTHNYESGSYADSSGNFNNTYGLSNSYWSSSQGATIYVWIVYIADGTMYLGDVRNDYYVRLGATF